MHLPLTRATALDRGSRGVPFFPTMTHHFVTIIAIIRRRVRRERETEEAHVLTRKPHTQWPNISVHRIDYILHTDTAIIHVTWGSLRSPRLEIDRFFPRSLVLLCFDKRWRALVSRNHLRSALNISRSRSHSPRD